MNSKNLLVIPKLEEIEKFLELAKKENLGFEYNDFCMPDFLRNEAAGEAVCKQYESLMGQEGYPSYTTLHGVFFDIAPFSDDPRIAEVSLNRMKESVAYAKRLGCNGVVFHTNYIPNLGLPTYKESWALKCEVAYRDLCEMAPEMQILVENMCDLSPDYLVCLAEKMKDVKNFGVCFDYAHAKVFGKNVDIEGWVKALAPYVKHIHVNDNDLLTDSHEALGDGKIDFKKFKEYYETYFQNASVLLEVSGYEKAVKSVAYLKEL